LIRAVLSGDQARFRPLMERHQRAIFAYLYRLLNREREAAQDLTQTTFLKAYQSLAAFDLGRPFAPWLYRIAHNEAANHLRSRSRRPEVALDDAEWADVSAPPGASPEAVQAEADDRRRVLAALEQLRPEYREALVLYYFEEKSYQEIGAILNRNVSTVGTLIRRARLRLQEQLEGGGESFSSQ
jgi:RNA polymerase sigma-70 factor (ECF subfamily)